MGAPLLEISNTCRSGSPRQRTWMGSFFAVNDPDEWTEPIEDLSEP